MSVLNNKCFRRSTLQQIEGRKDPFTREPFTDPSGLLPLPNVDQLREMSVNQLIHEVDEGNLGVVRFMEIVREHLYIYDSMDEFRSNDYGQTPLYVASEYGNLEIVQFLMDHACRRGIEPGGRLRKDAALYREPVRPFGYSAVPGGEWKTKLTRRTSTERRRSTLRAIRATWRWCGSWWSMAPAST